MNAMCSACFFSSFCCCWRYCVGPNMRMCCDGNYSNCLVCKNGLKNVLCNLSDSKIVYAVPNAEWWKIVSFFVCVCGAKPNVKSKAKWNWRSTEEWVACWCFTGKLVRRVWGEGGEWETVAFYSISLFKSLVGAAPLWNNSCFRYLLSTYTQTHTIIWIHRIFGRVWGMLSYHIFNICRRK